jgi:hypothetical protein
VPFRKAYLRSLIETIEIDDAQVRIRGSKDELEKAVFASQNQPAWYSQAGGLNRLTQHFILKKRWSVW